MPYQDFILRYDTPSTLFYLDPPYYGYEHYYDKELFSRYVRQHLEIIHRFGRFPHHNRILGRVSTPEEEQFLRGGRSNFG